MSLDFQNPALTVAIALAVGLSAQALGRHLRIPGIILLLAAGAVLGPDGLGLVDPGALGGGIEILVSYAVAVILFEGGLNLNLARLRRQAVVIRRLITEGALITSAGGAILARYLMGWDWSVSIVFGTLVMVTGPTVITPILRRTRIKHELHTILEAEGVFIDAVGALTAVAAFEAVFAGSVAHGESSTGVLVDFIVRFGGGCLLGLIGGAIMTMLVRWDRIVPDGLENVFILSLVLVLFQVSNDLLPESGIAAAAVAGVLVGNTKTRITRDLREFKEQLTVMLIGMLFVLLAADVRLEDVRGLGASGLLVVAGLMFLVRPLDVLFSSRGTGLTLKDKAFLSWLAPRGIVAAAVSSLFAQEMARAGISGGNELRALVFLVIAVTVLVQGLLASPVARLLGVNRPHRGCAVLGANALGLALGETLREGGREVVFIDNNASATRHAEEAGFKALWGSGADESVLQRAELEGRQAGIGTTTNEEINHLFAQLAREQFRVPECFVAMQKGHPSVPMDDVRERGARILYGGPVDLDRWALRFHRGRAVRERWELVEEMQEGKLTIPDDLESALLPLAWGRGEDAEPFHDAVRLKPGRRVWFAIGEEGADKARTWLRANGWTPSAREVTPGTVIRR